MRNVRYDVNFGHLESVPVAWSHYGQYGVHLFFIISGFVIFWTLNRTKTPFDFIVSRFSRLYPVYWVSIFITVLFVVFFELPDRVPTLSQVLVNLTMLQAFVKVQSVDGVYWTLAVELIFYAIMFAIFMAKQLPRITLILMGLVIISIVSLGIQNLLPIWIRQVLILDYISLFSLGVMLHKSLNKQLCIKDIILILLSIVNVFVVYNYQIGSLITTIFILILAATHGFFPFLRIKLFSYFGAISYSLYLIHQYVGFSIILKGYSMGLNPYVSIFIALLISILIASLLTFYVEKPALALIREFYNKSKNKVKIPNYNM